MYKMCNWIVPGALASLLMLSPSFATDLVPDDLITGSSQTSPWLVCDSDSVGIDVTTVDSSTCAFRTTPALPGITYSMSCGVTVEKFASITLAFLDASDDTLATQSTEATENGSGVYSVTLDSPPNTVTAAIGIFGETGSGFQDCVLIDSTPPPEPTKGSISGVTWFDQDGDSVLGLSESLIEGSHVSLLVNGRVIEQTETYSGGGYYFGHLDVDVCYTVAFTPADSTLQFTQPGGDNDAGSGGLTGEICLTESAPDVTDVDAGFVAIPPAVPPADNAICGVSWADLNANGVFDNGDSTLTNVVVRLFNSGGDLLGAAATDGYGNFVFDSLVAGDYLVQFATPDGYEPTIASGQPLIGTSSIGPAGNSPIFSLPADSNTAANSACTLQYANGGFIKLPVALDPTVANDDSVTFDVGVDFAIDVLANDAPCEAVHEVVLLGHNVPGQVSYDASQERFLVSNTTAFGTYSIEYGLRGACGSFDTATVLVELLEVIPPAPPAAPDAPVCRVETRGQAFNGGVDVFNTTMAAFTPTYNFYDRNRDLVITVDSTNFTHKNLIGNDANENESPFIGSFEIEWNGAEFGYDQTSIFFVGAVENGVESNLTECIRNNISPIALDLDNGGRIGRLLGDYHVDLDGDGIKEALSEWFAPGAGILVTADASGQVSGKHLFGNVAGVYEDGFAELATLDADKDGQLTGAELAELAIWNDRNSDTIVDEGELSQLADHEIVALSVTHYKYMSRATKSNGQSILMEDVWLPMAHLAVLQK